LFVSGLVRVQLAMLAVFAVNAAAANDVLQLHPENPHYFLWRGKPTILITSGEHYGAVLNLDFDYVKYLEALAKDKLNLTRTFTGGAYVEPEGAFNIARNTLAPAAGRYIAPWARSDQPGYAGGGNKFDLSRWDDAYFQRLLDFVRQASERGIVVEMNLFCPMYEETQWQLSPLNAVNNINGMGNVGRDDLYTLDKHAGLLEVEERMTRKIVEELKDFDNVYYEVMNEPYARGVSREWQHHVAEVIVDAQQNHTNRKLISLNIANQSAQVRDPHPAVSIFNFHYAAPPDTVEMNFQLNKVIGDNETGFRGTSDTPYRTEAWDFLIAGGGLYNNLDYSFAAGHEDGTFQYPPTQPGGGNSGFRTQMRLLAEFMNGFDFIKMRPDNSIIKSGLPPSGTARALVHPGQAYAIYLRRDATQGPFSVRWTGTLKPDATGQYTFHTHSNDGVRLWIDEQLLIDKWVEQSETEHTAAMQLEADRSYALKLEYFYTGGQGAAKLWWSRSGMDPQPIAPARLQTSSGELGLTGEYFRGRDLTRQWRTRVDANIDFTWGTRSPFDVPAGQSEDALVLDVPQGKYSAQWVDPLSGEIKQRTDVQHPGGDMNLPVPAYGDDIALRIQRQ
jgi:hypothetical protein